MTCEMIREQLIETARGRELSSDLRAIVFGHAARCSECAERLELQQNLSAALSEMALRSASAPRRVEELLLRRLPAPLRRTRPSVWEWAGAAAAAALVAGFIWVQPTATLSKPVGQKPAIAQVESSDFIALPFAEETPAEEPTDIVRVSLPGESLMAMGVPVNPGLFGEQVQADVVIGMDGTARAIRVASVSQE